IKLDKKNKYTIVHQKENSFFDGKNHVIVPRIKQIRGYDIYRRLIKFPKIFKELKPDIVLETSHIGPFRTPKETKRVTIIHDLTPILFPHLHEINSVIVHKLAMKHVIRNADLLLTPSENTKRDILHLYKTKAKIEVIYEGISTPDQTAHEPKEVGLPKITTPYFLYLGTIEPRKNLDVLVNTFLELKSKHNLPHSLVLAGEYGWKIKLLLNCLKNHQKDIILTGYITEEQKASLYKHANIFIYPSLYEGFGLPPLEAMSYGIPAICSTGGSLKEIFENHALMFEPNDKESLKKHILNLINNPQKQTSLSTKGIEYSKIFTWEKTARKIIETFKKIV
ncbi:glycosyltransferase family 4 protein, partial [Candidatus Peregrinibacteria bacterium]|nr:glycosyltransferase family 4 protein [Candidatus Peregrinibacteria bacterium]